VALLTDCSFSVDVSVKVTIAVRKGVCLFHNFYLINKKGASFQVVEDVSMPVHNCQSMF
jgi:hypothetical protein